MKFIVCAASLVVLLWGMPALAGPCTDDDADGVCDVADNCIPSNPKSTANPAQDDTDSDDCGNVCDPNFSQGGIVGFPDILTAIGDFGIVAPNHKTNEPIANPVGFPDILNTIAFFGLPPGPSGTTAGTTACP